MQARYDDITTDQEEETRVFIHTKDNNNNNNEDVGTSHVFDDSTPVPPELYRQSSKQELAIYAFNRDDPRLSRVIHDLKKTSTEEGHLKNGKYIKDIVYGGLDGILEQFAIVSGVAGSGLNPLVAILLGIATLFADALSMGLGDFLSEYFYNKYVKSEEKRERWECENYLQGEQEEMTEIYKLKGLSEDDARTVVAILSRHTDVFVNVMLVEELGLMPVNADDKPWKNAVVMFVSFIAFGCVPILTWIAANQIPKKHVPFIITCLATVLTLFALGLVKGRLSGARRWYRMAKEGLFMVINGVLAAGAAYLVGFGLSALGDKISDF